MDKKRVNGPELSIPIEKLNVNTTDKSKKDIRRMRNYSFVK